MSPREGDSTGMRKRDSQLVWGASPAGDIYAGDTTVGTKEYFERVKAIRNELEIPWLYDLLPFGEYAGKRVLEIGCGAGFDAFEFCRRQALYTGIDITPENTQRTRTHLSFYGYHPRIVWGDAESLPFRNGEFDVVFSNGVLHHTPQIQQSLREARRVLAPGGELWVIVYHRNSIFYWLTLLLWDHVLRGGFCKRSFAQRLSMIEHTTSGAAPLVNAYGRRELRHLLTDAGLEVRQVWVRKLLNRDLPPVPLVSRAYQHIPERALDWVGRAFGWYVIAKATKPAPRNRP